MTSVLYKFPRTPHIPQSPGTTSDDRILKSLDHLYGREVVVTEKFDGECTTLYPDYIHARSLDSASHPSREWVKRFHGERAHLIPPGHRVCGENLYAQHSLAYDDLSSFFYAFGVWHEKLALPWNEAKDLLAQLDILPVKELFTGILTPAVIDGLVGGLDLEKQEGFVLRLTSSFDFHEFGQCVAKWVRAKHVQTDEHWMHKEVVPNRLAR